MFAEFSGVHTYCLPRYDDSAFNDENFAHVELGVSVRQGMAGEHDRE